MMPKPSLHIVTESTEAERYLPRDMVGVIALEHWHRYLFASQFTKGKVILDLACGDGYGSDYLALNARQVYGIDISQQTIARAKELYRRENLDFIVGSCVDIPMKNQSVDVVVSFETIEHHDAHSAMMSEFKRVLKPDGVLVISSPDKKEYSERASYHNPFHVKELFQEEFRALLEKSFLNVRLLGQRVVFGSLIVADQENSSFARYVMKDGEPPAGIGLEPVYWVAVASDEHIPESIGGILDDARLLGDASASLGRNKALASFIRAISLSESKVLLEALSSHWYRNNNADVFVKGIDPYAHWLNIGSNEGRLPAGDLTALFEGLLTERVEFLHSQMFEAINAGRATERQLIAASREREERSSLFWDALRAENERASGALRQLAQRQLDAQAADAQLREQEWKEKLDIAWERIKEQEQHFLCELNVLRADSERARELDHQLAQRQLEKQAADFARRETEFTVRAISAKEELEENRRETEEITLTLRREISQLRVRARYEVEAVQRDAAKQQEESRRQLDVAHADADRARETERQLARQQREALAADARLREERWREQLEAARERIQEQERKFLSALRDREEQFGLQLDVMRADIERTRQIDRRLGQEQLEKQATEFAQREKELSIEIGKLEKRLSDAKSTWLWRFRSLFVADRLTDEVEEPVQLGASEIAHKEDLHAPNSLADLLNHDDHEFVQLAYLSILGRDPDTEGRAHYVDCLHNGISKLDIVWILRMSPEGRAHKSQLEGLGSAIRRLWLRRVPVLAYVMRSLEARKTLARELHRVREDARALQREYSDNHSALQSFVEFDPDRYRSINADVATAEINPYEHYIRFGYSEKRKTRLAVEPNRGALACHWLAAQDSPLSATENIFVDILIPIYNGYELLEPLFESLLANTRKPYRLILVDDCSTDQRIAPLLQDYANKFTDTILLTNSTNQGFIASVNRGMEFVKSEVFILQNSDTEVPSGWLERLIQPMQGDASVATVTPFSNAATICSFPVSLEDNALYLGLSVAQIDNAFSSIGYSPQPIEIPTGVGFCMAMKTSVVKQIGGFDRIYGRGYGEENDWCMRAANLGYRHVLAMNLFVYHKHGGSFPSEEKARLIRTNLETLSARYPNYHDLIQAHIQADPAKPIREFIKVRLLSEVSGGALLVIDHNLGGGANSFRSGLVKSAIKNARPAIVLIHDRRKSAEFLVIAHSPEGEVSFSLPGFEAISAFLKSLSIYEVIYNNLVGSTDALAVIRILTTYIQSSSLRLTIMIHDFYPVCPSYTLINKDGTYCGVPKDLQVCEACIQGISMELLPIRPLDMDIKEWRSAWGEFMQLANEIRCFSESSKEIFARAFPELLATCTVVPHVVDFKPHKMPRIRQGGCLHIGVVGAINYAKGRAVLETLMRHIEQRHLNHKVSVIGEMDIPVRGINVTGRYEIDRLPEILENLAVNVILIPSIWPETFSYVTSELLMLDVPVACFNMGAPAERIRKYGKGIVLDSFDPESILKGLAKICPVGSIRERQAVSAIE